MNSNLHKNKRNGTLRKEKNHLRPTNSPNTNYIKIIKFNSNEPQFKFILGCVQILQKRSKSLREKEKVALENGTIGSGFKIFLTKNLSFSNHQEF